MPLKGKILSLPISIKVAKSCKNKLSILFNSEHFIGLNLMIIINCNNNEFTLTNRYRNNYFRTLFCPYIKS